VPTPRTGLRAAVLGSPISHSLSPVLHRAAYAALGLDWRYDAIEVDESGLATFLASLDDTWAGLSLTMPLKESVIDLLVQVEPLALAVTSVNNLLPTVGGWRGANTDVYGMTQALTDAGLELGAESTGLELGAESTGLVLGAGATARSALAALSHLGIRQVLVAARRSAAAAALLPLAESLALVVDVVDWKAGNQPPEGDLADVAVIVSTVPQDAGAAWATYAARCTGALLDASYHPWPTPLAAAWAGEIIANGRDMLLWQAAEQVRLMTGLEPPIAAMRAALPAA